MKITQSWFKKEIEISTEELFKIIYEDVENDQYTNTGLSILKFIQKLK